MNHAPVLQPQSMHRPFDVAQWRVARISDRGRILQGAAASIEGKITLSTLSLSRVGEPDGRSSCILDGLGTGISSEARERSSFLSGVSTKVLYGDPSKAGFYTIVLSVPAHTSIAAHAHRDDRMATVVSGTWQFGYGDQFNAQSLKTLPAGSVYSEPGGMNHFARTDADPLPVQISGFGPTDTQYVNPSDAPKDQKR